MFIFTHFRVLSRTAVVIGFCGWGFLLSGVALIVIHDVIDAQANALPGAVDPLFGGNPNGADDGLVLSIDNNETPIALDELTYFPASVEEGSGGECFEFVGTDVSLRGKFPPRFRDRWVDLLGKSVPPPASDQSPGPRRIAHQDPGPGNGQSRGRLIQRRGHRQAAGPSTGRFDRTQDRRAERDRDH